MTRLRVNGHGAAGDPPAGTAPVSPAETEAIPKAILCLKIAERAAQHENVPGEQRAILAVQIGTAIGILSGAIAHRPTG
jgi:hypothetical protein